MFACLILCSTAHAESIVDFIVANNPELQQMRAINRNILKMLKVEAKAGASYGQLTREGSATLEQAKTRYDIGLTASIPLISPAEKAQRRIEEAQRERTLRLEVAELIRSYRAELKAIEEENKILTSLYNELQWIGKRVEAGVDSQKEYNQKLHDYLAKRKDHEMRKEQVSLILEKILAYVGADKREKLKGMLHATLSSNSEIQK
ncbi:MAG: hypothetical protein QW561_00805 [Candidatus Aenigmatarchaeota archaeon]